MNYGQSEVKRKFWYPKKRTKIDPLCSVLARGRTEGQNRDTVECDFRMALFTHLPGKLTPSTVGSLICRLEDPLNDRLTGGHHPLPSLYYAVPLRGIAVYATAEFPQKTYGILMRSTGIIQRNDGILSTEYSSHAMSTTKAPTRESPSHPNQPGSP